MVRMAENQSGRWNFLMCNFLSSLMMGRPISETTKAMTMYISTFLKYQHRAAMMAKPPIFIRYPANLSMFRSFSIFFNFNKQK